MVGFYFYWKRQFIFSTKYGGQIIFCVPNSGVLEARGPVNSRERDTRVSWNQKAVNQSAFKGLLKNLWKTCKRPLVSGVFRIPKFFQLVRDFIEEAVLDQERSVVA